MEPPREGGPGSPAVSGLFAAAGLLFLLSGAAGLVHEVLWSRLLVRAAGGTWPAMTAVVAAFLGGLALGAHGGGRAAPGIRRPLRAFALLEAVIALHALLLPALLGALHPAFGWCHRELAGFPALQGAARFALAAALLLPATVAMGATLPLLVRAVVRTDAGVLRGTGALYGLNALGAAAGALLAGLLLMPSLGLRGTGLAAAAVNGAVALAALLLGPLAGAPPGGEPSPGPSLPPGPGEPRPAALRRALLLLAAGAGCASMLLQFGWTRALVLCFGSSVHAFSLVLGTFILGIGLGGLAAPLLGGARRSPVRVAALLSAAAGAAALGSVAVLADLPLAVVGWMGEGFPEYGDLLLRQGGRAALVVLPATVCTGALFPHLVAALAGGAGGAPGAVGRVYLVNTAGVLLGAVGGGLLLPPLLGTRGTLVAAAVLLLSLAAAVLLAAPPRRLRGPAAAALAAGAALAPLLAPEWPVHRMQAGVYLYGPGYAHEASASGRPLDRVLRDHHGDVPHLEEGRGAAVAVLRSQEGNLYLRVNGKTDASSEEDLDTQLLVGHLPLLARPGAGRVLVVGLGSGMSATAAAAHGPASLEVAELLPEVARAEPLFRARNLGVLQRPGVRLLLEDGRAVLEHGRGPYDVIVTEPTNPWIAGVSDLFTAEFFAACRERLAPDGVLAVWLQAYGLTGEDFRMVLRTVRSVFPNATVWELNPWVDYCILATPDGSADLPSRIAARDWPGGEAARSLAAAGIPGPEEALGLLFLGREAAAAYAGEGELHTDDRLQLEFRTPRGTFPSPSYAPLSPRELEEAREPGHRAAREGLNPDLWRAVAAARALGLEGLAPLAALEGLEVPGGDPRAVLADPSTLASLLRGVPPSLRPPLAERVVRPGAPLPPEAADAALRALGIGRLAAAREAGHAELWIGKRLGEALRDRALAHMAEGALDPAAEDLRLLREVQPWNAMVPARQATLAHRRSGGRMEVPLLEEALALAGEALALNPRCEEALVRRGEVLRSLRREGEAEAALLEALRLRPHAVPVLLALADLLLAAGREGEARPLLARARRIDPREPALLRLAER